MVRLFSKLFNIRPTEWPRLLILYVMFLVFIIGWTWGAITLEAAFLQKLGVAALPWLFVVKAIVSIPASATYAAFADQMANHKLLIAILMVGMLGIIIGLLLLGWGLTVIAYPLLYLILFVLLDDIISIQWHTYVNSFYDTQSAKRIIPVLVTSIGVGSIIAGRTISSLNQFLESNYIFMMWLSTLVLMALLIWLMPYFLREGKTAKERLRLSLFTSSSLAARSSPRLSHLDNLREGYRYVLQSTYLRWLALSALILVVLFAFLQFQTSATLLAELKTEEDFANYIGYLTWVANVILLPLQLFVLNRIISRIGLENANLIFPIATLATSGGLIFAPNRITAALSYLDRTKLHANIGYPIESLLYNAVPLHIKGRTHAFIGGLVVPVGAGIGGMLLLLLPFLPATWLPSVLIAILAIAYLVSALVIRKQYSKALITMLEQEDFSFLLSQGASNLTVTDPVTLQGLCKKLEESNSYEFTIFMAKLISQIGSKEAVPILGQAARAEVDARSRSAIIDALVAADTRGEAVRQLCTDFLEDEDGRVRQSAMAGLEQLTDPQDKQFLAATLKMLADPDTEVQARVLPILLKAHDPTCQNSATQTLNEFLTNQDSHQRARGVHILNQTGDLRFIETLLEYLTDPADEVRLEAAIAIEALLSQKLSDPMIKLVLKKMNRLVQDPVERVRQVALTILGRMGNRESHRTLINALTDPSPQIRTTAVDALVQIGKSVIPTIHPALNASNPLLRKMTTVTLSRINQREFGPLIETHITGNLLDIYRGYGLLAALTPCAEYPTISVLQSLLREQNEQLLEEIFYLLMAIHDKEAVKIVAESFHSETSRVRANATEALESLTTPQTAKLISPLFEPELTPVQLLEISQDAWEMSHPPTKEAIKQILTNPGDPWLRSIMTLALGEMGAVFLPQQTAAPQSPTLKIHELVNQRAEELVGTNPTDTPAPPDSLTESVKVEDGKARRPRPTNLLDRLTETSDSAQPKPEPQPEERPTHRARPIDLFGALIDVLEPVSPQLDEKAKTSEPLPPPSNSLPFTLPELEAMIETAFADPAIDVRLAARAAKRIMVGSYLMNVIQEEGLLLSAIEKIIFLKEVLFFRGMTVDQLKVLVNVCEEQLFEEDAHIFNEGDPGGALYVVVSGRVGIEQEKRKGSFARLATIEAHSYFGEMNLFDNSPRSATAIALQDTLTLRLRREPLIALARQYPDLSLELISVLSQRLREANNRVADLTRTRPRELHKLFDQFD